MNFGFQYNFTDSECFDANIRAYTRLLRFICKLPYIASNDDGAAVPAFARLLIKNATN